ncbi:MULTISPECIES: bifunctional 2-polyprenyl-6-hydroxyphenol methylase/3-demethylubiquinol 3-O-methyltransferase UbiG [unclassified Bacillus cereus group]|uniref:class I SAM-dependent methyltransferase n=1 Tax=unclassified Bacillus cereus group TaxID=2750818 RepID=UPI001F589FBF|nr:MULTISPECIES: class I SAM-dependent methyltransferase [unclassified Bacillus cereus group]
MNKGESSLYNEKPDFYYTGANPHLLKHIKSEWKEVLDIGCSEGGLGAVIKEKGVRVSGIEAFSDAFEKAKQKLDHVLHGDIETMELPYEHEQFDCIIFGDVLEHLFDPWAVIEKVKPYVKKGGVILASIPNVAHISVIQSLLAGNWTYTELGLMDKTHIRFFTFNEMLRLFLKAGFSIQEVDRVYVPYDQDVPLIEDLQKICSKYRLGSGFLAEAVVYQYVILAEK